MDPGPEGKVFANGYKLGLDSFEELDPEEWLHGLQFAEDGKGEQASRYCGVENTDLSCKPLASLLPASSCSRVPHPRGFPPCFRTHLTLCQLTPSE